MNNNKKLLLLSFNSFIKIDKCTNEGLIIFIIIIQDAWGCGLVVMLLLLNSNTVSECAVMTREGTEWSVATLTLTYLQQ